MSDKDLSRIIDDIASALSPMTNYAKLVADSFVKAYKEAELKEFSQAREKLKHIK